jgi:hypothetical protein
MLYGPRFEQTEAFKLACEPVSRIKPKICHLSWDLPISPVDEGGAILPRAEPSRNLREQKQLFIVKLLYRKS